MTVPFMGHIDQNGLLITKGSRETPNFLYCTNGARNDSKIFHTEENGKYYQYHKLAVNQNDVNLRCMYHKNQRAHCCAHLKIRPKKPDLIYGQNVNGTSRYFLAENINTTDLSGDDWETVPNSGLNEHSEYCQLQLAKADQPKLDDYLRDQMTGKEIQSFNKNFSRFGPYEPLARHLRFRQTRAAIRHHEIKLKHTIKELNIDTLGPRFLPSLTVIQNEKKAASLKILIHFMIYRMICNKI